MSQTHWYFSQYQTPNIVIVPTEEPLCKKAKLDVGGQGTHQNTDNMNQHSLTNLITIPTTPESSRSCSNSVNKSEYQSKLAKTSWATNFLQSIGQVHEKPLSITKKPVLFEDATEKTDSTQERKSTSTTTETPSVTQLPNISLKVRDENINSCFQMPVLHNTQNINEENFKPFQNENAKSKLANENNEDAMKKDRDKVVNKNVSLESAPKLYKNKTDDKSSKTAKTFIARDNKKYPDKRHSEVKSSHSKSSYSADKLSNSNENRRKPEIKVKHLDSRDTHKTGSKIRSTSSSKRSSPYTKKYESHKSKNTVHKIVSRSTTNIKEKIKYFDNKRSDHKDQHIKSERNNKNIDKTSSKSSKYESVKHNENKIISPIRSVVQIPDKYKSSSAASPSHSIHTSIDLRNKLWRKNDKADSMMKKDEYSQDKYQSTKKDNLIISINNTNDTELETETKDDEQPIKEINFVINIIFEQKNDAKSESKDVKNSKEEYHHRQNEQQQSTNNHVDLSFLDDFNIDEIVESLNDSKKTQNDTINVNNNYIANNDAIKRNEYNKSDLIELEHVLKDYRFESNSIKCEHHFRTDIISKTNQSDANVKKEIVKKEVKNISEEEQKVIIVHDDDVFNSMENKNIYTTENKVPIFTQKPTMKIESKNIYGSTISNPIVVEDLTEQQSLSSSLSTTDDVQMSTQEQNILLIENVVKKCLKNEQKSKEQSDNTEDIKTCKKNVSSESIKKQLVKQEDKNVTEEQEIIIMHDNNLLELMESKNIPTPQKPVTTENNMFIQNQIMECKNIHVSKVIVTEESANHQNLMTPNMLAAAENNIKISAQKQAVQCEYIHPTTSTEIIDVDLIPPEKIFIKEPANHQGLMPPCNVILATAENNAKISTQKQCKNHASTSKDSIVVETSAKQRSLINTRLLAIMHNVEKGSLQKVQKPNDQLIKKNTETIDLTIDHTIDLTIDENDSNRNTLSENNKSVSLVDDLNTTFCQKRTNPLEREENINRDSKQRLDINENRIENVANADAAPKCRTAYVCEVASNNSIEDDEYKCAISDKFDPNVEKENSDNSIVKETGILNAVKMPLSANSKPDLDNSESKTTRIKITEQSNLPDNKTTSVDGAIKGIKVVKPDILMNKFENKELNKSSKITMSDIVIARKLEECIPDALRTRMSHKVTFIQKGKFSKIFISENVKGHKYAIKVLHPSNDRTVDIQKTNLLTDLQKNMPGHSYKCVDIINSFSMNGFWCLIMDYFPWNLQQALKAKNKSFHVDVVQNLTAQLVTAVMTLNNNNIVHLDIKPNHILLNGLCNKLKLCGFDSARYLNCPISVLPNVGMANYRAPEIILGYKINYKVDVWMAAVVIYEMATNNKLFPGVFNNDILFKQMCKFGDIPYVMIVNSAYGCKHFLGTSFKRRTGARGEHMSLITQFDNSSQWIGSPIHQAFTKDWNMCTLRQKIENRDKLNSLIDLLERMLVLFPDNRFPIEFVSAHPFVFESYQH